MFREIRPEKIFQKRNGRPRREIVEIAGGYITEQDLYAYEKGDHKPSMKKLPYLLKGLGATYDEISEPVELMAA